MELNASTIEAIVKKIVSEMDTPAAAADDLTIPVGISNRHIHMSPADGARFGVKDGDYITVDAFSGTKRTRWFDVQVRVSDKFCLEMHVDTDDANAVGFKNGSTVTMVKE